MAYKVYPPVSFVFVGFSAQNSEHPLLASCARAIKLLNRRLLREVCASDRHKHKNQENKQMQQSKIKAGKEKQQANKITKQCSLLEVCASGSVEL